MSFGVWDKVTVDFPTFYHSVHGRVPRPINSYCKLYQCLLSALISFLGCLVESRTLSVVPDSLQLFGSGFLNFYNFLFCFFFFMMTSVVCCSTFIFFEPKKDQLKIGGND